MANPISPRKPVDTSKNMGGDMTIFCFIQSATPRRFTTNADQHVRGLNAEAFAQMSLPAPDWIQTDIYKPLRQHQNDNSPGIYFSINLAIYNQATKPDEWADSWFFVNGRVHPYALTWEDEQLDGLESEVGDIIDYTIPTMIIRDLSYQPIEPRSFSALNYFPLIPPSVCFTGAIAGPGSTLLNANVLPTLDKDQLRLCAFINLCTYLKPGDGKKTPFTGYHPFQVFVIFPIHIQPWKSMCKKFVDRGGHSPFQPTASFYCAGKIAGMLNPKLMKHPPQLEKDYMFIVVPDNWTFLPGTVTPYEAKTTQPAEKPKLTNAQAIFATPTKRKAPHTPPSSSQSLIPESSPETPSRRPRINSSDAIDLTGGLGGQTVMQTAAGPVPLSADTSFNTGGDVSDDMDELQMSSARQKETSSSTTASEAPNPVRRTRHLAKKS